tara:strand:+ start:194 stop:295 length:102 start_codon:yes stop_codon:yes gene_type:complete
MMGGPLRKDGNNIGRLIEGHGKGYYYQPDARNK